MARFYYSIGLMGNIEPSAVKQVLEKHDNNTGVGLDKIINFDFNSFGSYQELNETYWEIVNRNFMELNQHEWWVSHDRFGFNLTPEKLSEIKKINKCFYNFFRAIKDEYNDNETRPNVEVTFLRHNFLFESLNECMDYCIDNIENLDSETLNFFKMFYTLTTECIKQYGDLATLRTYFE